MIELHSSLMVRGFKRREHVLVDEAGKRALLEMSAQSTGESSPVMGLDVFVDQCPCMEPGATT